MGTVLEDRNSCLFSSVCFPLAVTRVVRVFTFYACATLHLFSSFAFLLRVCLGVEGRFVFPYDFRIVLFLWRLGVHRPRRLPLRSVFSVLTLSAPCGRSCHFSWSLTSSRRGFQLLGQFMPRHLFIPDINMSGVVSFSFSWQILYWHPDGLLKPVLVLCALTLLTVSRS